MTNRTRCPVKNLLRWAKRRADKYDLPFTLTEDDIEIPSHCPVFGIPLYSGDGASCNNSPTIDRIVPYIGYVPGNVIVISSKANRIKTNASWMELKMIVDFYEEHIAQSWMQPITNNNGGVPNGVSIN